jgi:RNA-directed DNA polymerase
MRKPKYVLDADIEKCFDRINHQALLSKINTSPKVRRQIKSWLKAGVMEGKTLFPTEEGTPQGGVISPLLANIALHGLEQAINEGTPNYWYNKETKKSQRTRKPFLVRYADDFVILHEDLEVVKKCQLIVEEQLSKIGLRLKEEKTKLVHTLDSFNSQKAGFDFLGFNFRQYKVNPGHAQKDTKGNITNHATYIKPSKEAVKKHLSQLRSIIKEGVSLPQKALIDKLGTVILGWSRYYSAACSKEIFTYCDHVLTHMLLSWAYHRHPNKGNKWCVSKYWDIKNEWSFKDVASGHTLMKHAKMPIRRYEDVIVNKSPYDGDWVYWSKRQGSYPTVEKRTGKLLKAQAGKCSFCGLYFKEADVIELDHRIPRSCGGKDDYSNWQLLHRHCHHQKTASDGSQRGVCDKHLITEEPDEVKVSRPVLKPSQTGDCLA